MVDKENKYYWYSNRQKRTFSGFAAAFTNPSLKSRGLKSWAGAVEEILSDDQLPFQLIIHCEPSSHNPRPRFNSLFISIHPSPVFRNRVCRVSNDPQLAPLCVWFATAAHFSSSNNSVCDFWARLRRDGHVRWKHSSLSFLRWKGDQNSLFRGTWHRSTGVALSMEGSYPTSFPSNFLALFEYQKTHNIKWIHTWSHLIIIIALSTQNSTFQQQPAMAMLPSSSFTFAEVWHHS